MKKSKHRNKAALTPAEFVAKAEEFLGPDTPTWRKRFCNLTGYTQGTVTRMIQGTIPVTEIVATLFFTFEIMTFDDRIDYIDEFGLEDSN